MLRRGHSLVLLKSPPLRARSALPPGRSDGDLTCRGTDPAESHPPGALHTERVRLPPRLIGARR